MVEYLEDMIEHDPMEAWSSADIGFKRTGDKAIDKWEKEIAEGKTPDLGETIDPKVLERWLKSSRRTNTFSAPTPAPTPVPASKPPDAAEEVAQEFSDRYDEEEAT
jgi:hypothetical protein